MLVVIYLAHNYYDRDLFGLQAIIHNGLCANGLVMNRMKRAVRLLLFSFSFFFIHKKYGSKFK